MPEERRTGGARRAALVAAVVVLVAAALGGGYYAGLRGATDTGPRQFNGAHGSGAKNGETDGDEAKEDVCAVAAPSGGRADLGGILPEARAFRVDAYEGAWGSGYSGSCTVSADGAKVLSVRVDEPRRLSLDAWREQERALRGTPGGKDAALADGGFSSRSAAGAYQRCSGKGAGAKKAPAGTAVGVTAVVEPGARTPGSDHRADLTALVRQAVENAEVRAGCA